METDITPALEIASDQRVEETDVATVAFRVELALADLDEGNVLVQCARVMDTRTKKLFVLSAIAVVYALMSCLISKIQSGQASSVTSIKLIKDIRYPSPV